MNMLLNLGILSIFFLYFQDTLAEKEEWFFSRDTKSPLAVIRRQSDSPLEPATPTKSTNESYLRYVFDKTKGETFFVACPISSESNDLLKPVDIERTKKKYYDFKCEHEFKHISIDLESQCANGSKGQLFGVGYYIEVEKIGYLDVYNICRIDGETHFTIHEVDPLDEMNYLTENQSVYRFVPSIDMPTHTLQITTKEAMNSMPLNIEKELQRYVDYLNKVDKAIRGFVKTVGYKARIYTGFRTSSEGEKTCKYIFKVLSYIQNKQFVGFAVITRFDSSKECENVCDNDISKKIKYLHFPQKESDTLPSWIKNHFRGFNVLTYACVVDTNVIETFGLNEYIRNAMEIPSFHGKSRTKQTNAVGYSDDADVTSTQNTETNDNDGSSVGLGLVAASVIAGEACEG